jgi:hypothetical protein
MEGERRLVREDARLLGPQPDAHELLMLAGREVHQAVDASTDADDASAGHMVNEKLGRVASVGRLLRREEPLLCGGDLVEPIPVGMF